MKEKFRLLALKMFDEGMNVELIAQGYSMFPLLQPGDSLLVVPKQIYKPGAIVVFDRGDVLVAHRLIKIKGELAYCKGDGLKQFDAPFDVNLLKGEVESRSRSGKIVKTSVLRFIVWRWLMVRFTGYLGFVVFFSRLVYCKLFVRYSKI